MYIRLDRAHRFLPVFLGVLTLIGVGVLLVWDAFPGMFPAGSHDYIAAFPLALIAIAYLAYQVAHRPTAKEFAKAAMLAAAFLFWAANQMWPNSPQATLYTTLRLRFSFWMFSWCWWDGRRVLRMSRLERHARGRMRSDSCFHWMGAWNGRA